MTRKHAVRLCTVLLLCALACPALAQMEPPGPPPGGPPGMGGMGGPGNAPTGPAGPGMPGAPRGPMRPQMGQGLEQVGLFLGMVRQMAELSKDPATAGMLAIGGMKDDVRRPVEETIADLEKALQETKALPLRNALRLTLKDLYKQQGQDEKVLQTLREMLKENDAAIMAE